MENVHPLFAPLPSSKHLLQIISKHDHTTSHHLPLPAYLLLSSILKKSVGNLLHCIPLVHQLYTAHGPHHRSFCSSQNSYFIFCSTAFHLSTNFTLIAFHLSTNFTLRMALTIDLSGLLKIATLFSFKHQIFLPYNIADLT